MPRPRSRRPPQPPPEPPLFDPDRTPAALKQIRRILRKKLAALQDYRAFKAEEAARGFGVLDANGKWWPNAEGDAPQPQAGRVPLYDPWADEDDQTPAKA